MPTNTSQQQKNCPPQAGHIESAIQTVAPVFNFLKKTAELQQIANAHHQLQSAPTTLLVCGEFKRGKSTFVNALLQRPICATDTDICTSVASIIKYGPEEKATRYYGDFSNIRRQEIDLDDLETYTVGSAKEIDNTIYVEIELPLPALKAGLIIIDTPGVGGLDPRHATLTNFFLPKADVALFMTDVNEPLTSTELEFLKTKVVPAAKAFSVIVNKADLKEQADVEDIRLDTVAKIAAALQLKAEQVPAIAVSAAAELYPDADLGQSNFQALRTHIAKLVESHRSQLRAGLTGHFIQQLDLVIAPIQTQIDEIEQPSPDTITNLNNQKQKIDTQIEQLSNPSSPFRTEIDTILSNKRESVIHTLTDASTELTERFNVLVKDSHARGQNGGQWLGNQINDALAEMASDITNSLEATFLEIAAMPEFEQMLQFSVKQFTGGVVVKKVDTSVPIHQRILPATSALGIGTFGGSFLATTIGLGPIGWVAAIGTALFVAASNVETTGDNVIESRLRSAYLPHLSGAISHLRTHVDNRFSEFQKQLTQVLAARLKAERDALKVALEGIAEAKQNINKAVTTKANLQKILAPLVKARDILSK